MSSGPEITKRLSTIVFICMVLFTASPVLAGPVVLFDQGHGQQFMVEQEIPLGLSQFAGLFTEQGAQVKTSDVPFSITGLADIDVLIISGAFAPISKIEAEMIMAFLRQGGKVAMMTHIASPYKHIFSNLGISFSSGVVREQENIIGNNPTDFLVKDLTPHFLTSGLDNFSIYGGWALLARNDAVHSVARTSSRAWVDLNKNDTLNEKDAVQAFSMVLAGQVGEGAFVVFGDDAIFQNQFLVEENLILAKNLATWFCGKEGELALSL
ncbi:MAG: DUF4350 domain-containing protein [Desulfocapsa sp.]|nr:DUF4350 domain-containing protein [Desulfocapsa sp.]